MAIGFGLLGNLDVQESADIGRRTEELGYDSLWFAEHNFSRDGISACPKSGAIANGAKQANRNLAAFDTAMLCVTLVAESKREAFEKLRPVVATYLARLPDVTRHTPLGEEGWQMLADDVSQGGAKRGAKWITDELIADNLRRCLRLQAGAAALPGCRPEPRNPPHPGRRRPAPMSSTPDRASKPEGGAG